MATGRLEAFSDGVFAIAITLLVLDLAVPARNRSEPGGLAAALGHQWPSYFAYLVSFLIIGIIWVNHHTVFDTVRLVDRPVLFANLALLLVVSALPFPTRLLAEYLTAGYDSHVAAAIYSAAMLTMGLAFGTPLAGHHPRRHAAASAHRRCQQPGRAAPLRTRQRLLSGHDRVGLRQRDRHPGCARRPGHLRLLQPTARRPVGQQAVPAGRPARLEHTASAARGCTACGPTGRCGCCCAGLMLDRTASLNSPRL
jgi:uncharacterized membrane protein